MPLLVLDPEIAREYRERFDRYTETWDGVDVVAPLPNDEHQDLQTGLVVPLYELFQNPGLGRVRAGVNVAHQHQNWRSDYRGPDVVVYLNTNPAVNHGSHWVGGPDFLVEIISEGEDRHAKLDFYAAVSTREVLIIERNPWAVELFTLANGTLVSAGRSEVANGRVLMSTALGVTFRLVGGSPRPKIAVTHPSSGRSWEI